MKTENCLGNEGPEENEIPSAEKLATATEALRINPRNLAEVRQEIGEIDEDMDRKIDKKIKELVIGLRRWSVETLESCEGHRIQHPFQTRYPFVRLAEKDKKCVEKLLGAYEYSGDWAITITVDGGSWILHPKLQEGEDGLLYPRRLWDYQKTARQFGKWLQNLPDDYDFSKRKNE